MQQRLPATLAQFTSTTGMATTPCMHRLAARRCCGEVATATAWLPCRRSACSHLIWSKWSYGNGSSSGSTVARATTAPAPPAASTLPQEAVKEQQQQPAVSKCAGQPQKLSLKRAASASTVQLAKADRTGFKAAGVCFYAFKPEDQQLYLLMVHERRQQSFPKAQQQAADNDDIGMPGMAQDEGAVQKAGLQGQPQGGDGHAESAGTGPSTVMVAGVGEASEGGTSAQTVGSEAFAALSEQQAAPASSHQPDAGQEPKHPITCVWNFPGGKRKRKEYSAVTAAREVEEETHCVVTADTTAPLLSFAQCHYIGNSQYNMFLAELPDAWDIPEKVQAVVQAGQQHKEATKVVGAAWVRLDRVQSMLRETRVAMKRFRATLKAQQKQASGGNQGEQTKEAPPVAGEAATLQPAHDAKTVALDGSGAGQMAQHQTQRSAQGASEGNGHEEEAVDAIQRSAQSQPQPCFSSSFSALVTSSATLSGAASEQETLTSSAVASEVAPSEQETTTPSSVTAEAAPSEQEATTPSPLTAEAASGQDLLAVVALTALNGPMLKWLVNKQAHFRGELWENDKSEGGVSGVDQFEELPGGVAGGTSGALDSAGSLGSGFAFIGRRSDGAQPQPDAVDEDKAGSEPSASRSPAPREPLLWTSGPDARPLSSLLPRPVRTVLRVDHSNIRAKAVGAAAVAAAGEKQQEGQELKQRPQWRQQGEQRRQGGRDGRQQKGEGQRPGWRQRHSDVAKQGAPEVAAGDQQE